MTPGQTRLVLGSFIALAVGVGLNATLFQGETRSAESQRLAAERLTQERQRRLAVDPPKVASAQASVVTAAVGMNSIDNFRAPTREETAVRFARLRPDAAKPDNLPHAPDAEGNPETIKAVQRELTTRHYGPLIADGVPGQVTRAAIMAFEFDNRLALTGEATEALLTRILLGPSGSPGAELGHGKVRSIHAEQMIRTVQQSLVTLGYQPGRIDGRVGDDSERAIREFEMDQGLVPTGRVSAELFSRLARALGAHRPVAKR
jgi:Putative peptidoglycan binding domain